MDMADLSDIKFTVTRLCGGQDLLLTPSRKIPIDLDRVYSEMNSPYPRTTKDFIKFDWHDLSLTLYPAGSILFWFFNNRPKAEEYARQLLSEIVRDEDAEKIGYVEEKI